MKKKVKIRVVEGCTGNYWLIHLMQAKTTIFKKTYFSKKSYVIKRAEEISKILNIDYDPKIIKAHDC